MEDLHKEIDKIQTRDLTDINLGYSTASKMIRGNPSLLEESKNGEYETRIILLTDAMPNIGGGQIDHSLRGMVERNAKDKIYSTFIGIGVSFNSDFIEKVSKVRGANYYSVHSEEEFKKRMDNQFEFMVTPIVFDVSLSLDTENSPFEILNIFGSDVEITEENKAKDILKINTLFPSAREGGETKGGIVLVKLKKKEKEKEKEKENECLRLLVSYFDRAGKKHFTSKCVDFFNVPSTESTFDNTGIQKGIILTKYAELLKNWLKYERNKDGGKPQRHGKWERESVKLNIGEEWKAKMSRFQRYFRKEMKAIGDETMSQEIDVLSLLLNHV